MARSMQLSNSRAETIANRGQNTGHGRGNINRLQCGQAKGINTQPRHQNLDRKNYRSGKNSNTTNSQCIYCGGDYPYRGSCPAEGNCGTLNHFARICRKKGYRLQTSSGGSRSRDYPRSDKQVKTLAEQNPASELNPDPNSTYHYNTSSPNASQEDASHSAFQITDTCAVESNSGQVNALSSDNMRNLTIEHTQATSMGLKWKFKIIASDIYPLVNDQKFIPSIHNIT